METQEKTIVPQNKYMEGALEVETMTVSSRKRASRKRKLTPEENRALNASLPAGNKYVEAARRHKGSFIVYDPNFML